MSRLRSSLRSFFVLALCLIGTGPASAQSLDTVLEQMKAAYHQQFDAVDTYVVKTNLYTSYNKQMQKNGEPAYKTEFRIHDDSGGGLATAGAPSTVHNIHFGRLRKHATYAGTDTVDGTPCHVLRLRHLSDLHANAGPNVTHATYYIHANRYLPVRTAMVLKSPRNRPGRTSRDRIRMVTMSNYRTTDGLVLPHRTEIEFDLDLSKEKRRQRAQMMENLSDRQRKRMKNAMRDGQMNMVKQMTADTPIVITVDSVSVNAPLPEDVFESGSVR